MKINASKPIPIKIIDHKLLASIISGTKSNDMSPIITTQAQAIDILENATLLEIYL